MMPYYSKLYTFNELTIYELYKIMQLRQEVFVVEQNCPYLDADGKDLQGHHLLIYDQTDQLVAYARLLPVGVSYANHSSIGRVVNTSYLRGTGIGKLLMQEAISNIKQLYPDTPIKIGAQAYLKGFYESLGFTDLNQSYLEDGIPHLKMVMEER